MTSSLAMIIEEALELAPEERIELAHQLQLSVSDDKHKLETLRASLRKGDAAFARGDFDEVPIGGLPDYLSGLVSRD